MVSSNSIFRSRRLMPISSSSSAMGKGVAAQSRAISSHCPARMGCSMEWSWNSERRCNFSRASVGEKAPLASTRSSIWVGVKCRRMCASSSSSFSKSMAPILSLMQRKPCCIFSPMRRYISSKFPIQMSPLMGMPSLPLLNGVCQNCRLRARKCSRAVSIPNRMDG